MSPGILSPKAESPGALSSVSVILPVLNEAAQLGGVFALWHARAIRP